jgi:ABC-2 type transport system ATP-binding protein
MANTAIKVSHLSKNFKLPHEKTTSVKSALVNFYRRNKSYEMQQALNDISFEIQDGEFFGIVGRNGSGKSTLLKTLAGIYVPSEGSVEVNGLLTPFIELGVGFNPELTGRENVFLNGALLGFNRREMAEMYQDIVDFAELERFMDQRLKNYSSGMQVRLAFSIAIRAKSDILLIDEVLAVGDEAFQRKCLDIFEKYKANKQTVILVTHDMDTVRKYCSRAMLLNDGKIIDIGSPHTIADKYSQLNEEQTKKNINAPLQGTEPKYLKIRILGDGGSEKQVFDVEDTANFEISWEGVESQDLESIGLNVFKLSGEHITGINTRDSKLAKGWKDKGKIVLELKLNINSGKYYLLVEAFKNPGSTLDRLEGPQFIIRQSTAKWSGLVRLPYRWRHEK